MTRAPPLRVIYTTVRISFELQNWWLSFQMLMPRSFNVRKCITGRFFPLSKKADTASIFSSFPSIHNTSNRFWEGMLLFIYFYWETSREAHPLDHLLSEPRIKWQKRKSPLSTVLLVIVYSITLVNCTSSYHKKWQLLWHISVLYF